MADLSTAEAAVACALTYDWCHDLLSHDERRYFRRRLEELALVPYLKSVERNDWWVENHVTNWCGVVNGGCGLAAHALLGESQHAHRVAELAWKHAVQFLRTVNRMDGGGDEGISYYIYGNVFAHYLVAAHRHMFGEDDGVYCDLTERMTGYWMVYMLAPDGNFANFNANNETEVGRFLQGHHEAGPNNGLCALLEAAVPGGDPLLLWGADNGGSRFYWNGGNPFYFLWRRDAPPAGPKPELQDAALFRGCGHAILQPGNLWLAYNGGWISDRSHKNLDLGSFILLADGERLVNDWGRGHVETADHSTILVNGRGQRKGTAGRYLAFGAAEDFQYFASDLSECYVEPLVRFTRHVLVVGGRYVLLLDDLETPHPARFEWRLQTEHPVHTPCPERAVATAQRHTLQVMAPLPSHGQRSILRASDRRRTQFTLCRSGGPPQTHALFATILCPLGKGEPTPSAESPDQGRLLIRAGDHADEILFQQVAGAWRLSSVNGQDASRIAEPSARIVQRVQ